jgi:hypothetical protein
LPLDADGVLALLEESRVVDGPDGHGVLLLRSLNCVARGRTSHFSVAPGRFANEVEESIMAALHVLRLAERSGCDGLDALPLALAQDAESVGHEGLALLGSSQVLTDDNYTRTRFAPSESFACGAMRYIALAAMSFPERMERHL